MVHATDIVEPAIREALSSFEGYTLFKSERWIEVLDRNKNTKLVILLVNGRAIVPGRLQFEAMADLKKLHDVDAISELHKSLERTPASFGIDLKNPNSLNLLKRSVEEAMTLVDKSRHGLGPS
jgi:hypothetical protein